MSSPTVLSYMGSSVVLLDEEGVYYAALREARWLDGQTVTSPTLILTSDELRSLADAMDEKRRAVDETTLYTTPEEGTR